MPQLAPSAGTRNSTGPSSRIVAREPKSSGRQRILIVGHGMVGARLCEELRSRQALRRAQITIIGGEAFAYDRVHLADVIRGATPESLRLHEESWYEEKHIRVHRGESVCDIDRERKRAFTESGHSFCYDSLVLAVGSDPIRGSFSGSGTDELIPLREVSEAKQIRRKAEECRASGLPAVVIGGGLLGVEVADELQRLGLEVHVLESAEFPLSRQLEDKAGRLLARLLQERSISFHPKSRVQAIEKSEGGTLLVELGDGTSIESGLVIPAMGIRPRDQLARKVGLRCDLFGGVEVDDHLRTSDPAIYAVGECARHRGTTYGLVAPGYLMAEVVAKTLSGASAKFSGSDVGTRLKVQGVELTVVGESQVRDPATVEHLFADGDQLRRLAVRHGKIVGLTAVGAWDEMARAQEAVAREEKVRPGQLRRFTRAEPMWKNGTVSLQTWPDAATVCTCMGVTCGALRQARNAGCANAEALSEATGAGTVCGSCRPLLETVFEPNPVASSGEPRAMLVLSALSSVMAVAFLLAPAIPFSDTVQGTSVDVLWRSETAKQVTGFSILGLFLTSVLLAMRKRIPKFTWGNFDAWRITHAAIGALCLVGGVLHTGFRLGERLDFALSLVFVGSVFLGGLAGGWSMLEGVLSPPAARRLRSWLIRSHIFLLWPLPVLLAVHVAKAYWF